MTTTRSSKSKNKKKEKKQSNEPQNQIARSSVSDNKQKRQGRLRSRPRGTLRNRESEQSLDKKMGKNKYQEPIYGSKQKRLKKIHNLRQDQEEEEDSFMNERSLDFKKLKKNPENQNAEKQGVNMDGQNIRQEQVQDMVLVADISQDSSSSEQRNIQAGKCKKKKKSKSKKSKKCLKRQSRKRNNHSNINQDDILDCRSRPKQKRNYAQIKQVAIPRERTKLNILNINKDIEKIRRYQSLLVSTVLSDGIVDGVYRFFQVQLRNGDKMLLREKDMIQYFPIKLAEYRQRILNKVAKSTAKLNFVV